MSFLFFCNRPRGQPAASFPHSGQNFTPFWSMFPHAHTISCGRSSTFFPHTPQNFAPSCRTAPHSHFLSPGCESSAFFPHTGQNFIPSCRTAPHSHFLSLTPVSCIILFSCILVTHRYPSTISYISLLNFLNDVLLALLLATPAPADTTVPPNTNGITAGPSTTANF